MKRQLLACAGLLGLLVSGCCCDWCNCCNPCGNPCGSPCGPGMGAYYTPQAAPVMSAVPGTYAPVTAMAVESLPTY